MSAHTGKMSIVAHGGSTSFMYTVGYYQLVLFLLSTHAHIHFSTLVFRQRGVSHLAILDPSSLTLSTVKTAFTDIYGLVRAIQQTPIPQTHHSLEFTQSNLTPYVTVGLYVPLQFSNFLDLW